MSTDSHLYHTWYQMHNWRQQSELYQCVHTGRRDFHMDLTKHARLALRVALSSLAVSSSAWDVRRKCVNSGSDARAWTVAVR